MEIGEMFYAATRNEWRAWLKKFSRTKPEIWLVYFKKESGIPRIPYNDAVEEALCYGWIDSILKPINGKKFAQRFSPRRPGSQLSPMNRERMHRLIRSRKMTAAGLHAVRHVFTKASADTPVVLPQDIRSALMADKKCWGYFKTFPRSYKRIRIGWIDAARHRPAVFRQRLRYFIAMTAKNKRFGMVQ